MQQESDATFVEAEHAGGEDFRDSKDLTSRPSPRSISKLEAPPDRSPLRSLPGREFFKTPSPYNVMLSQYDHEHIDIWSDMTIVGRKMVFMSVYLVSLADSETYVPPLGPPIAAAHPAMGEERIL